MYTGHKRGKRIIIDDEKASSTLRNKGFKGINHGEKLSLDLISSYYLYSKRKIDIYSGSRKLTEKEILSSIGSNIFLFHAYRFLREKGYKPIIKNNSIYVKGKKIPVIRYPEFIVFSDFKRFPTLVIVVDDDGDCILYQMEKFNFNSKEMQKLKDTGDFLKKLKQEELTIKSGSKYGSDYRIYEDEKTHAKYLLNIENKLSTKDLVARVRVAHSVKKTYVQGYEKSGLKFLVIKWITV